MRKLIGVFFLAPLFAMAAPSPMATQEINHLFAYLKNSGCEFQRNNSWYTTTDAAAHLQTKYDYLIRKDRISSAEDFIELAATESSMSGKPYRVKCADGASVNSGLWFRDELARYRKQTRSRQQSGKPS
jgi:hypothetical protein